MVAVIVTISKENTNPQDEQGHTHTHTRHSVWFFHLFELKTLSLGFLSLFKDAACASFMGNNVFRLNHSSVSLYTVSQG